MSVATNGDFPSRPRAAHGIGALLALLLAVVAMLAVGRAQAGVVHPDLEARLASLAPGSLVPVIVVLEAQGHPATAASHVPAFDRRSRGRAVVQELRDTAARTQAPLLAQIAQEQSGGNARGAIPLWIINGVAVTATEAAIRRLAARSDVKEVRLDASIPPPHLTPAATSATTSGSVAWNIAQIRAPEVWAIDPGYNGTGVVVGSFDTGVDGTHPDLAPRYRGNDAISWFDPYGEHASPFDANGHGTHTTGTAVGGDASGVSIGVAPGAKWIAAKGWDDNDNATVSAFHQIFQWFLAPGGDPANAPDVVNDSWGLDPPACYPDFLPDVQALRAAGIFPVFAAGNDGPGGSSILSPGNYAEAFAVGATDDTDTVADFSSRGPSQCDGEVKPDMSAPGVSIYSSLPGDFWFELDGTSMATPHVTGAVAVLKSINPSLTVDDIESALVKGAVDLGTPGADDDYGAGRLDLFESARIVIGKPLLGIAATTPKAYEAGTVAGVFTVSREGDTSQALAVPYTVSGTATPGADYAALSGSVTIPAGAASATITVAPIDDTLLEYDETVVVTLDPNPAFLVAPAEATVTIVSDELFPDLTMSALAVPAGGGAGLAITVTDTTKNIGGGPTPTSSTTTFYLSANAALDAADTVIGSRTVGVLAPGASDTASTALTIPPGTATGSYYVIAKADSADVVPETSEANNALARSIWIGPDLTLAALNVPAAAGAGLTITVGDTTQNQGGGAAAASVTRYYLSSDAVLDASDVMLGARPVSALGPGATSSGSVTVTIPAATATGGYYLIAKADADDAIAETQETNNTTLRPLTIGSDLAVAALNAPSAAGAGLALTVGDTTKNQGAGPAPASTTSYYLSADATLDAADILLGSRAVAALAPGASDSGSITATIPAGTATGAYYLIAQADAANVVAETSETNNTSARMLAIGPDLAVSAFSAPAAAGAGATISVTDTTKNQGAGAAGATTTRYYLSSDGVVDASDTVLGARSVAALAPGASDTGSATLTIPAGTAGGSYYLIAKADGLDVLAETQETNNASLRTITIGGDLVVSALAVPAAGGAGASITVTDTTKNQGGGAIGPSTTTFYLSANAALDAADIALGSRGVGALAPGASDTASTTLAIPAGTATGTYFVIAKADSADAVSEVSETNNTAARAIPIGPDLAVAALNAPATAGAGATVTVSDTTQNLGGGAAPSSVTRYYLSTDSVLDASDVTLGARAVGALAAGASDAGSATLTIPAGTTAGTYYLFAKADGDDAIVEAQETNNTALRTLTIGADLVVASFAAPSSAGAGLAIAVSDTTKNQGGGASGASTTAFYLSLDQTLDASDVALGTRAVSALAAGASDTASTTLTIPAGTATGTYFLIAMADSAGAVAETSETNNAAVRVLLVGPDLAIGALSAPDAAGAGATITVTDTTRNQGAGAASATTTRYYLSTNTVVDASDAMLGARAVAALAPGASDSGSATLTIPAGTAGGGYYLIARADDDNAVAETQEGNNAYARPITIGGDLVVSALTVPAAGGAGASITVTDTTKNQGGGTVAPSTTSFYLSANTTLDASDVLLGSRSVAALGTGASDTASTTLTIPSGTATGAYFVIAKADSAGVVAETSETNNTTARSTAIGPDLAVAALAAPPSAGAGTTITVSDTTQNLGGGDAPPSTTRYYLSPNSVLDATDPMLGARAVGALAAGASDAGSVTLTIPAGTAAGTYYIFAKADGDDAIVETQEWNNVVLRSLKVGP